MMTPEAKILNQHQRRMELRAKLSEVANWFMGEEEVDKGDLISEFSIILFKVTGYIASVTWEEAKQQQEKDRKEKGQ